MKKQRRTHSAEFKARIALEAVKGLKTVQQIAADNHLHPVQVTQWKNQMIESASGIFTRGRERVEEDGVSEVEKARLERKVGQLVVEVDWPQKKMQGAGDRSMRKQLVEKNHPRLSLRRQCQLLGVNRNRLEEIRQGGLEGEDLKLARRMDELHLRFPEFGARRMKAWLVRENWPVTRRRVGRIMRLMGLEAIYRKPRTSQRNFEHKVYPYLLRDREVVAADEVWCADVTYIPMDRGFAYLVAVMDWKSRAVISWKLSNTMDTRFCVEALEEAFRSTGTVPEIFNTDQGSQFTSKEWISALEARGVQVSMDGKGRWIDNVFIERLWRSVKHEGVYLWSYATLHEMDRALSRWFEDYNRWKPHRAHEEKTPWECYRPDQIPPWSRAA
ncbi:MAG: IS3 family transposase [Verrucomicrobiota bacterium]